MEDLQVFSFVRVTFEILTRQQSGDFKLQSDTYVAV